MKKQIIFLIVLVYIISTIILGLENSHYATLMILGGFLVALFVFYILFKDVYVELRHESDVDD